MNPVTVELKGNEVSGEAYLVFRNQGVIDQLVPVDVETMMQLRNITNQFIEQESQRIMAESFDQESNE